MTEAAARIKINRLLEEGGWRFFDDEKGKANIRLEAHVALAPHVLDSMGEDFEREERGFVDFLLLDERGFPLIVLEAKSETKDPLSGKEQARRYARSLKCRFVILSNGNLHYLWDLDHGQSPRRYCVPQARLGERRSRGNAPGPAAPRWRARRARLHRPFAASQLRLGGSLAERGGAPGFR